MKKVNPATTKAKKIEQMGLVNGDRIALDVVTDGKDRAVFKASFLDFDSRGNARPSVRIVHLGCSAGIVLSEGERWEGNIRNIELTKKVIPLKGKEYRVIYFHLTDLRRVEVTRICFRGTEFSREIMSGKVRISHETIPAMVILRKMCHAGQILNIGEVRVAGRLVMRTNLGQINEARFADEQREMLRGRPFDLKAYKRRMPALTKSQYDTLNRPFVTWENMLILQAEAAGTIQASAESLQKLASLSSHARRSMPFRPAPQRATMTAAA